MSPPVRMAFAATTMQVAMLTLAYLFFAAAFAPLNQSVIPDVLPGEETFAHALVGSWIAYWPEAVPSPVIAAALMSVIWAEHLSLAAALAFVGSILALSVTRFPARAVGDGTKPFLKHAVIGLRIYRHTPRLRGLSLLNFALSLAMAWVLVNSMVFAGLRLGDAEMHYPILMAFCGLGAALGAVLAPTLVKRLCDRMTMMLDVLGIAAFGPVILILPTFSGWLAPWPGFGLTSSLVVIPGGLVIMRSARQQDRPAVCAAQHSLSHAGWLLAYLPADHPQLHDFPVSAPGHAYRHYHINDLHPGRVRSTA